MHGNCSNPCGEPYGSHVRVACEHEKLTATANYTATVVEREGFVPCQGLDQGGQLLWGQLVRVARAWV
ncbi:conserved hypothetical protein [Ricinus communis]|uniref:Uncharacterized protein n=1 Tax=Ricinus communis TaxID=3988 RepID=B9S5Y9_RICCO|nr:conserved hypothetical protein [Ricinus communis]